VRVGWICDGIQVPFRRSDTLWYCRSIEMGSLPVEPSHQSDYRLDSWCWLGGRWHCTQASKSCWTWGWRWCLCRKSRHSFQILRASNWSNVPRIVSIGSLESSKIQPRVDGNGDVRSQYHSIMAWPQLSSLSFWWVILSVLETLFKHHLKTICGSAMLEISRSLF